jgi:hypothetical protein
LLPLVLTLMVAVVRAVYLYQTDALLAQLVGSRRPDVASDTLTEWLYPIPVAALALENVSLDGVAARAVPVTPATRVSVTKVATESRCSRFMPGTSNLFVVAGLD